MDRLETPINLLLLYLLYYLHSSMDRLETLVSSTFGVHVFKFTFQYGQIRNISPPLHYMIQTPIYIPVWIDQKLTNITKHRNELFIYIPVWIDQKLLYKSLAVAFLRHLHSSMDRLETFTPLSNLFYFKLFTFQYGQIRNIMYFFARNRSKSIYIPVWIDQKLKKIVCHLDILDNLHSSMDRLETAAEYGLFA